MFGKMLKLTMVLFVLMTFFVLPPSILSDDDGWGSPVYNKVCKGTYDTDVVGSCSESDGCTGSIEYKVISESEGCVTESYGTRCYTRTVAYGVGTAPCKFIAGGGEVFCTADTSGLTSQESTDCKSEDLLN